MGKGLPETASGVLERLQGCLHSTLPHGELGEVFRRGAGGVLRGAGGGLLVRQLGDGERISPAVFWEGMSRVAICWVQQTCF